MFMIFGLLYQTLLRRNKVIDLNQNQDGHGKVYYSCDWSMQVGW